MTAVLVAAASCLSLLLHGCSCAPIGCVSAVDITIAPASEPYRDGRYTIEATLDGTSIRALCTLEGAHATCDRTGVALSRGAAGMLALSLVGTPKHIDLKVSFGARMVTTTSFDPQYTKSDDSCSGNCPRATHVATSN